MKLFNAIKSELMKRPNQQISLITILVGLFILTICQESFSQDSYRCLLSDPIYNEGCDYTQVPNDVKTQSLIINGDGDLILLGHCATQQDVIDAFIGWFDNVIDPETDCS